MKYPWLYVNAKVVCLQTRVWRGPSRVKDVIAWICHRDPRKGDVATVTEVECDEHHRLFIRLDRFQASYAAMYFRPLHDTSTQLEAMREIVRKASERGRVDA